MRKTTRARFRLALLLCAGLLAAAGCDEPTRSEPVAAVELTVPTTRLAVGQSIQLAAAVRSTGGQVMSGRSVAWSSSNEAVATVDAGGRVTGRAPGPVTITAAAGGKQERVELVVEAAATAPGPVARVSMEPDSFLLVVGNTVAIRVPTEDHAANARARVLAVPRDAAGAVLLWLPVSFSTSNAAVATVSDSGVVRAVGPGTATITARTGGAEGRLTVTVERPWTTTYLGTLPGTTESLATAIGPLGQVVGQSGGRGWIWQDGRMTALTIPDSLGAGASVFPQAVNARGQVGGTVNTPSRQYIAQWEDGRVTLVPSTAWPNTRFGGMNERGEMVGSWVSDRCTSNCHGVGWIYRAGVVSQVGAVNTTSLLTLVAINDRGQIAANRGFRDSGRAYLLESAAAEPAPLPTSQGGSNATDIDEGGRVYGQDFVNGEVRAFVWSPAAGVRHFAPLPGGAISGPARANNLGLAVGWSGCTGCPASLPVIFRDGRAIRIEDLVAAGGDWVWETAADVNDRGQVVGWGKHRATGVRGALLLAPPAP